MHARAHGVGAMCSRGLPLLLLLTLFAGAAHAQQLALRIFREGPSHTQGWDLLEDQRGFVWVATTGGLTRYDGTRFLHFGIADGMPNQTVRALVEGTDGALWMGTDEGIVRYDGRQFESITAIDQQNLGTIWKATRDRHGTLWFISGNLGIVALPAGADMPRLVPIENRSGGAVALQVDAQDGLWIGWFDQPASHCRFDAQAHVSDCRSIVDTAGEAVWGAAFESDAQNRMVIAEQWGRLLRWNGEAAEPWLSVPTDVLYGLTRRRDGAMLVATTDVGAFLCEPGDSECLRLDRSNGLPDTNIYSIRVGGGDRVWFLTGVGIAQWNEHESIRFALPEPVRGTRAINLWLDPQQRAWVSTTQGLARLTPRGLRPAEWQAYTTNEGLGSDETWMTYRDREGRLWVATTGGPCLLTDETECKPVEGLDPPPGMSLDLSSILQTRDGRIWMASSQGVMALTMDADDKVVEQQTLTEKDGLLSQTVYVLTEDTIGRLWIGTTAGINVLDRGHLYRIGRAEGLPAIDINAMVAAADGSVWIGLNGGGLARIAWQRGEPLPKIDRYGAFNGVPDTIERLAFAPDHEHLWITSERDGVFDADTTALIAQRQDAVQEIDFFGMDDLRPIFSSQPLADGRLWVVGQNDVAIVRPLLTSAHPAPRARVSRVDTRDAHVFAPFEYTRELDVEQTGWLGAEPLEFTANEPRVRIEFHSAQLDDVTVYYRTQLQGFEQDWGEVDDVPFREYTNLGPGEYHFRVQAALDAGPFGPAASVTFRIPPAFWQTPWFILLLVLAFVGAGVFAHRLRLRAVARQNQALERQVAQRTADLESATARALAAERSKRRFLAGMTHELRTPLTALLGFARLLLDRSKNDELQRYARNIYDSGDELLNHINNMLDYARLESGQMQVHRAPTQLETVVHIACAMMEGYAARREVTIDIDGGGDLPELDTDATKLRQMLLNLLSNAVKFSPQANARVHVSWRLLAADASPLQRASVEIAVRDDGIGIAADDLAHIFDEFRQAEGTSSEMPSSGLGLSIVRQFAHMLDGTITVESERGRGSCFRIVLPV